MAGALVSATAVTVRVSRHRGTWLTLARDRTTGDGHRAGIALFYACEKQSVGPLSPLIEQRIHLIRCSQK